MMNESDEQRNEVMNCGLSMQERAVLRRKLHGLEDTVPPRAVWQRIEEQARAEGLFAPRVSERAKWLAGAGLAAAVVLTVLNVPFLPLVEDGAEQFPTEPEFVAGTADGNGMQALDTLMVQSAQLERNLRALPAEPSLVRAGTAATISELQDQIAAIDYVLNHPELQMSSEQQEIYWRERVRLMHSLLQLRAAQAQRVSF